MTPLVDTLMNKKELFIDYNRNKKYTQKYGAFFLIINYKL